MRQLPLSLAILALAASAAVHTAPADSPLDGLAWLAGCWQSTRGDRVTEEMWLAPSGGLMVGAGRTVAGGQVRGFEHLRLGVDGTTLVYTAIPSGQKETVFRSTAVRDDGFTVENPSHDFPQRIVYERTGPDAVTARVEGPGRDGGTRGFDIEYRRVACEASR